MPYVESHRQGDELELNLSGRWDAASLGDITRELDALDLDGVRSVRVTGQPEVNLSGAWILHGLQRRLAARDIPLRYDGAEPEAVRVVADALKEESPGARPGDEPAPFNPVEALGRGTVRHMRGAADGLEFTGRVCVALARALGNPRRLRPISIVRHVYDTGITALPIVSLIAFLISVILAYLSAGQLQRFGAEIFVVDLITVGVLRELGVLLTAIIIAGRSGSAFAAEIGAMKLNEEVDALHATGVDPMETLVLPRVLGLIIALPLLTVVADLVGLAGGALLANTLLDMPVQQFIYRADESIAPTTFWVGIWKAPVFAVLIAMSGAYRGMQVRGSSRELGRLTTMAVVQSIFLVLLADALFAILFMELDV